MKWISIATLSICALSVSICHAQNTYKWTDDEGKVHYGTTLPPEYSHRPYEVMNQSGVVVKRVEDPLTGEAAEEADQQKKEREAQSAAEEKQRRADRLLVLKYSSEEAIHEAMEVEIANLAYDARLLEQTRQSLTKSMEAQVREAADRQRAGLPLDPGTPKQVAQLQARIKQGRTAMAALDSRKEKIRAAFMVELERYQMLTSGRTPN